MPEPPQTFEDVDVGATATFGDHEFTKEGIVAFAEQWDPQPFHVDEAAARESLFGGLIASGWHVCAVCMRLSVEHYVNDSGSVGAIGVDELRWREPVRPGDVVRIETEVLDKEPFRPGLGLVRTDIRVRNQRDDVVASMVALSLFPREED